MRNMFLRKSLQRERDSFHPVLWINLNAAVSIDSFCWVFSQKLTKYDGSFLPEEFSRLVLFQPVFIICSMQNSLFSGYTFLWSNRIKDLYITWKFLKDVIFTYRYRIWTLRGLLKIAACFFALDITDFNWMLFS